MEGVFEVLIFNVCKNTARPSIFFLGNVYFPPLVSFRFNINGALAENVCTSSF